MTIDPLFGLNNEAWLDGPPPEIKSGYRTDYELIFQKFIN